VKARILRVRSAVFQRGFHAVDHIAAIAWNFDAVDIFCVRGPRFGILSGNAPDLDDGLPASIGKDNGHLQDDFQRFPDARCCTVLEIFGTVTALQQKGISCYSLSQIFFQPPDLTGKNKWRQLGDGFKNRPVFVEIRPIRLLQCREI
jgi:hypothetical protein